MILTSTRFWSGRYEDEVHVRVVPQGLVAADRGDDVAGVGMHRPPRDVLVPGVVGREDLQLLEDAVGLGGIERDGPIDLRDRGTGPSLASRRSRPFLHRPDPVREGQRTEAGPQQQIAASNLIHRPTPCPGKTRSIAGNAVRRTYSRAMTGLPDIPRSPGQPPQVSRTAGSRSSRVSTNTELATDEHR